MLKIHPNCSFDTNFLQLLCSLFVLIVQFISRSVLLLLCTQYNVKYPLNPLSQGWSGHSVKEKGSVKDKGYEHCPHTISFLSSCLMIMLTTSFCPHSQYLRCIQGLCVSVKTLWAIIFCVFLRVQGLKAPKQLLQ